MHINDLPRHLDLTSTLTGLNSNEDILLTTKKRLLCNYLFQRVYEKERMKERMKIRAHPKRRPT